MEWNIILMEIFEVVLLPLLGVLTGVVIRWITLKTNEITSKNANELANKYINMLSETIVDCVKATNQTYVSTLKAEGKFDAGAQEEAFNRTLEAVNAILTEEAKVYLATVYGDLNKYITQKIEAEVLNAK